MSSNAVTVIGSSNIDLICRVPRLPRPGETIAGGRFTPAFGGKGANQAVAAARSGAAVTFITRLGGDDHGRSMRRAMQDEGIRVLPESADTHDPTGTALILVDDHGENCIAVAAGANANLTAGDIEACSGAFAAAGVLLMQMEVPPEAVDAALSHAHDAGVYTVLNYAPVGGRAVDLDRRISLLIVNETEAAELTGMKQVDSVNAQDAINRLRSTGVQAVALTLGSAGVAIGAEEFMGHVPGIAVRPVDTTGAGDTFCGAIAAEIASGLRLHRAAQYANAAAALSIQSLGAQSAVPARDAVQRFLQGSDPGNLPT